MGWAGALIGGYIGSRLMGSLGALLGAVIGHGIAAAMKGASSPTQQRPRSRTRESSESQSVFCASAAAMLAKMAKADGVVTQSEIAAVEAVFRRLKFSAAARRYAVEVFRKAKDDAHSIYEYANDFAAVADLATRELLYELLWDLAAADGEVSEHEERILRYITSNLGIAPYWCSFFARKYAHLRGGASSSSGSARRDGQSRAGRADSLEEAYSMLGVAASASDDEVKKAYREKAKQYHPDRLRAQGLPDGMIKKANERMAAVNDAWSRIKSARGMK